MPTTCNIFLTSNKCPMKFKCFLDVFHTAECVYPLAYSSGVRGELVRRRKLNDMAMKRVTVGWEPSFAVLRSPTVPSTQRCVRDWDASSLRCGFQVPGSPFNTFSATAFSVRGRWANVPPCSRRVMTRRAKKFNNHSEVSSRRAACSDDK